MILSTQTTFQKIWLELANYPKVEVSTTSRKNKSMYGFLDLASGKEHVFSTDKQNMYETRKMLRKIRKLYPEKKIFLLWDNVGWHKGSIAQTYIQKDGRIEQLYFPKYSPKLNPQEHVWKQGRHEITHNQTIENIKKTSRKFVMFLNSSLFHYSILGINLLCTFYS